jgi:hypothetical protein
MPFSATNPHMQAGASERKVIFVSIYSTFIFIIFILIIITLLIIVKLSLSMIWRHSSTHYKPRH